MKLELPKLAVPQLDALRDDVVRILTAPAHRRALLAGATIVLGLGFWYFAIAHPMASRVAAFKTRHESAQREIRRLGSPAGAEELKARVTALEARVRAAVGRMSQDVQFVQILKQISADSARYRIAVEKIDVKGGEAPAKPEASPSKPVQPPGPGTEPEPKAKPLQIRTQTIELTLAASYEATARLLDGLKTLPAFVVIDTLKVERDPSTFPNLKVFLTLKLHSLTQLPEELTKL